MKSKLINMTQAWNKVKKSETPTGIEPMTSTKHLAGALSTELQELMESTARSFNWVHM